MIYSKNIITLAAITVALGILTTTQVNAANNNTSTQKNSGDGKVITWGLAKCVHNSKVGLICGMKNPSAAGAKMTKNATANNTK
jgi:hypothetical protein